MRVWFARQNMDIQNSTLETVKGEVIEKKDDKEIVTENPTEAVDMKKPVACETDSIPSSKKKN